MGISLILEIQENKQMKNDNLRYTQNLIINKRI